MKRAYLALFLTIFVVTANEIKAQSLEFYGFSGIQLGGTAHLYIGDLKIEDALNYGGKMAVALSKSTFAEFTYMRTDTEGRLYENFLAPSDPFKFSSNYFQIGGLQQVEFGRIAPYATITAGLTWWDPKDPQYNSKTQFSAGVGAGLKIWITDAVGIRMQGTMLMPMVFNGFGFGCGYGSGGSSCGSSVYTRITPFQGEFSGGLMIKISPK
jgi:hypothetical protein